MMHFSKLCSRCSHLAECLQRSHSNSLHHSKDTIAHTSVDLTHRDKAIQTCSCTWVKLYIFLHKHPSPEPAFPSEFQCLSCEEPPTTRSSWTHWDSIGYILVVQVGKAPSIPAKLLQTWNQALASAQKKSFLIKCFRYRLLFDKEYCITVSFVGCGWRQTRSFLHRSH